MPTARPALWFWIARRRRWLYELAKRHDVVYIPRYAYPLVDIAHAAGVPAVVHMHGYPTYKSLGIPGDWRLEKGAALLYAALAHRPVEKAVDRWLRRAETAERLAAENEAFYIGQHLALIRLGTSAGCAVRRPLFCLCDLPEMAGILSAFDYENAPAVILPQPGLNITYILENSYIHAQNSTELELYVSSHLPGSHLITPFFLVAGGDPRKTWAKAPLAAFGLSPDFLNYLHEKGVKEWPWQSDYGYGVVYTESAAALALNVETQAGGVLAVRALRCPVCGTAEVYIDGRPAAVLSLQSNATSFTWLLLTELTPGRHKLEIRPRGLTVVNVAAAVPRTNLEKARLLLAEARGVEQLHEAPPGRALCRKEAPTRWTLAVNTTAEPAVVVLPVPYDPLWSAGDEKAVAVYGVNAGFYLKTGRYEVVYQPERVFQAAVVLAAATVPLLACLKQKS